jgi:hypothetical protein
MSAGEQSITTATCLNAEICGSSTDKAFREQVPRIVAPGDDLVGGSRASPSGVAQAAGVPPLGQACSRPGSGRPCRCPWSRGHRRFPVDNKVEECIHTIPLMCDHVGTPHGKEIRQGRARHARLIMHCQVRTPLAQHSERWQRSLLGSPRGGLTIAKELPVTHLYGHLYGGITPPTLCYAVEFCLREHLNRLSTVKATKRSRNSYIWASTTA